MSVFRHHFLHHPGTHGHTREWKREITLSKTIKWEIKPEKLWKWEKDAVSMCLTYFLKSNKNKLNHIRSNKCSVCILFQNSVTSFEIQCRFRSESSLFLSSQ